MQATLLEFPSRARLVVGAGAVGRVGELAGELGAKRILLVTDAGIVAAGHAARAQQNLQAAGLRVTLFDRAKENPTTKCVEDCVAMARAAGIDTIVGLGGGSSMDTAKGCNFILTNGGRMQDYWGAGKATQPMLPLIAVPTTAGTGSEVQSFAIIANSTTHMKMACGDKKAAARIAILDPELTLTMPSKVTAATGIDAISHAIESHVTKARTTLSQLFSRRAWQLLSRGLPEVLTHGDTLAARGDMLLGAHLAGAAIENSMLGATHSLANPLSAHFGVTHGVAVGLMLPQVIRFNATAVGPLYGELAADAGLCLADDPHAGTILAEHVARLFASAGLPTNLSACHVTRESLPLMAAEAAAQWTAKFNPRPVDVTSLQELYECAM